MARSPPPAPVFTLRSARGEVTAVHFAKRNQLLLSGHSSGHVQIWDQQTYRVSLSWSAHSDHRVQWIGSEHETILSYGRDGFVRFWIVSEGKPIATRCIPIDCFTHCSCDATAKFLATPTNDSMVHVWITSDVGSEPIAKLDQRTHLANCGMVMSIKLVELTNKTLLVLGYENGTITVCNVETLSSSEAPLSRLTAHSEPITCLDFHTETMKGISGSADDTLVVWNMNEKGELSLRFSKTIVNPGVASVKIHPDGVYVAVGGWDKRLRIFSWKTMKPLAVLDFHTGTVQCLDFVGREDDHRVVLLVAGSQDGRISLWNLYNDMNMRNKQC